jgi:hypothetical protein
MIMRLQVTACLLLFAGTMALAQFKSQADQPQNPTQGLFKPSQSIGSLLGLLNPDNFRMRHSFSFSYLSSGGTGLSLASYTNSMFYKIADPLNLHVDLTLQGSPFGDYGSLQQNDLSRLYVSRAELNYRPADNMYIQLQYRQLPFSYYDYYDRWYTPQPFVGGNQ